MRPLAIQNALNTRDHVALNNVFHNNLVDSVKSATRLADTTMSRDEIAPLVLSADGRAELKAASTAALTAWGWSLRLGCGLDHSQGYSTGRHLLPQNDDTPHSLYPKYPFPAGREYSGRQFGIW